MIEDLQCRGQPDFSVLGFVTTRDFGGDGRLVSRRGSPRLRVIGKIGAIALGGHQIAWRRQHEVSWCRWALVRRGGSRRSCVGRWRSARRPGRAREWTAIGLGAIVMSDAGLGAMDHPSFHRAKSIRPIGNQARRSLPCSASPLLSIVRWAWHVVGRSVARRRRYQPKAGISVTSRGLDYWIARRLGIVWPIRVRRRGIWMGYSGGLI